jgi:hypothetical protein
MIDFGGYGSLRSQGRRRCMLFYLILRASLVRGKRAVRRAVIDPPLTRASRPQPRPFSGGAETMPLFYFDLFYDRYIVLDPGGMSFEYPASASEAADELARDLLTARSELRKSGSWIRVRDERGTELYRSSIDPETPAPAPAA